MGKEHTRALGKGLSALLSDIAPANEADAPTTPTTKEGGVQEIALAKIKPSSFQPRTIFKEAEIQELSESIKKNGVIQPIIVRADNESGTYHIIAGERRWRASTAAGLKTIPAIIKDFSDKQALEIALIENIQRENLTAIEEAEGYTRLLKEFDYTQEQLGQAVGKSRSHVANMMRLLSLPDEVKSMINEGVLSMGHARTLIGADDPIALARAISEGNLSVREAEKLRNGGDKEKKKGFSTKEKSISSHNLHQPKPSSNKDEDIIALEKSLSESIGLSVVIEEGDQGGHVSIHFGNLSELDKIIRRLGE